MRLPRDISGSELTRALRKLGYNVVRQKGSHLRVTTQRDGEHHEVIPLHSPLKVGTLNAILKSIASHHAMSVEDLLQEIEL